VGLTEQLKELYFTNHNHKGCDHTIIKLADDNSWESIIDELSKLIFDSNYKSNTIPTQLYFKTAEKLAEVLLQKGFKTSYDDPSNALAAQLRANLYQFAGAKSLTEALAFSNLLVGEDGKIKSFNQYRQDVESVHGLYNEQYLSAEYQNAIAQGQSALQWQQWRPKDILTYSTAGDDRVRPTHAELEGLTLSASSPVWKSIYPPNDWGCRCTVVPGDESKVTMSDADAGALARKVVPRGSLFDNNPGITGIIFKDDHPYFESMRGIRELDAVRNYGMKPVEVIMRKSDDFPAPLHVDTETDYYAFWFAQVKKHGINAHDFAIKDKLGNDVIFKASPDGKNKENYFRDHIIRKQSEARHEYAANFVDVLQSPDEIFVRHEGKIISTSYIKYYNDYPHVLVTVNDGKTIEAETFYRADQKAKRGTFKKNRQGVLLHKK
jgi:SPP1 gp7 family putative phage head morphogenesis protein